MACAAFHASAEPAALRGRVLDGATGQPLPKARVYANPNDARPSPDAPRRILGALTDGEGAFTIPNVPPGRYRLSAERPGYAARPRIPWPSVTVSEASEPDTVDLKLLPGGVIAGRVATDDGEPAVGAAVHALRVTWNRGQRSLLPASTTQVNDLGEYRLFGLPPGRYYLNVTPTRAVFQRLIGSAVEVLPNTFFPGVTALSEATALNVTPGIQLLGIDLKLRPTPTVAVRGRVLTPAGPPPQRTSVTLVPRGSDANLAFIGDRPMAILDAAGRFTFNGVLPGSYTLALAGQPTRERQTLRYPVEVGSADIEGIEATLSPATTLTGRVQVDGDPAATLGKATVALFPRVGTGGQFNGNAVRPDLTFELAGVAPGDYLIDVSGLPDGLYLRAALFGGQDVTAVLPFTGATVPLTLSLSPKAATVEGVALLDQKPAPATVVLVPEGDRRADARFYYTTSAAEDGRFRFASVAPGDYRVFAWQDVEPGSWFDRDFIAPDESRAPRVSLRESSREQVATPVIPSPY
ncbi:MAG: carboxypeptidase regulatory-like domain-containing protein [Bryobacteraceae bacterium]|nr:carboxypeptidase regulatory-like domain-containing protein [Bryobacteraceae bacterium]